MDRPSYIGIFFLQLSTHMLTCAQILLIHIHLKMGLLVCDKPRLCFVCKFGEEERVWEKKNDQVEEIEETGRGGR